jgi:hypothetical protein
MVARRSAGTVMGCWQARCISLFVHGTSCEGPLGKSGPLLCVPGMALMLEVEVLCGP